MAVCLGSLLCLPRLDLLAGQRTQLVHTWVLGICALLSRPVILAFTAEPYSLFIQEFTFCGFLYDVSDGQG